MITVTKSNLHWNYFIALENDLAQVSRYVEFCKPNLGVFSIELAHLLLSAASEVDVVAKCVCALVGPKAKPEKIHQYEAVLILNYIYYRLEFKLDAKGLPGYAPSVVFKMLSPSPSLMTLPEDIHTKN